MLSTRYVGSFQNKHLLKFFSSLAKIAEKIGNARNWTEIVNGALRLLTNNMSNEILPLSDKTLQILSLKHPEAQQAHHEATLQGPKKQIHSIVYEDIDEDLVKNGNQRRMWIIWTWCW